MSSDLPPVMSREPSDFLDPAANLVCENNSIDPELYRRFNVKRGLRNADGSGVLVGLTRIGEAWRSW